MASAVAWLRLMSLIASCGLMKCSTEVVVTYTEAGVIEEWGTTQGKQHNRVKREITRDMPGLNHEEELAMLWRHNNLRSTRPASDMMYMTWDKRLAETAQKWAENCDFEHSTGRGKLLPDFQHIGENLYVGTHKFDPAHVVQLWYDEVKDYNYQTRGCTGVCGHYTQVVWADSESVGCGAKYCPTLRSAGRIKSGYHVVCHYGPGGNYVGQRPYSIGDNCSKCPISTGFCVKGLCSIRPKIGADAGQVLRSHPLVLAASIVIAVLLTLASRR